VQARQWRSIAARQGFGETVVLSAISFGPDRDLYYYLQQVCADFRDLCIYKTLPHYPSAYELVRTLNGYSPEIVFLEIRDSAEAFAVASQVRTYDSHSAIIGYAQQCDDKLLVKALEAGVTRILAPPFSGEELQQVLIQSVNASRPDTARNVTAFLPAKAGSGCSLAALNVAVSLSRNHKRKTLLADGDIRSGLLATLLGTCGQKSISEALQESIGLKESEWNDYVAPFAGLDLLAAPAAYRKARLSRWNYHRLLTFCQGVYEIVVVDLPEIYDESLEVVLTQARDVYLVTAPHRPALLLARRALRLLDGFNVDEQRVHIVLNAYEHEQQLEECREMLGRAVEVALPEDKVAVRAAFNRGGVVDEQTKLGRALSAFARLVAGVSPLESKEDSGFLSWLGLGSRN
jgi:pilus assembly protein CpaE